MALCVSSLVLPHESRGHGGGALRRRGSSGTARRGAAGNGRIWPGLAGSGDSRRCAGPARRFQLAGINGGMELLDREREAREGETGGRRRGSGGLTCGSRRARSGLLRRLTEGGQGRRGSSQRRASGEGGSHGRSSLVGGRGRGASGRGRAGMLADTTSAEIFISTIVDETIVAAEFTGETDEAANFAGERSTDLAGGRRSSIQHSNASDFATAVKGV